MPRKIIKRSPKLRKVKDRALHKDSPHSEAVFPCPDCKKKPPNWYFCAMESEWICCDCGAVLTEDESDQLVSKYKLERKW